MKDIVIPGSMTIPVTATGDPTSELEALKALVREQGRQLAGLKADNVAGLGVVEFIHCNTCGAKLSEGEQCPRCTSNGGTSLVNSVGRGKRQMPNGDIELQLIRQVG